MVLSLTQKIVDLYRQEQDWESWLIVSEKYILRYGAEEDADAILAAFLERPDWKGEKLLEPVRALGGQRQARRMIQECFQGDNLREDVSEDLERRVREE
jgi:hypothetical protein